MTHAARDNHDVMDYPTRNRHSFRGGIAPDRRYREARSMFKTMAGVIGVSAMMWTLWSAPAEAAPAPDISDPTIATHADAPPTGPNLGGNANGWGVSIYNHTPDTLYTATGTFSMIAWGEENSVGPGGQLNGKGIAISDVPANIDFRLTHLQDAPVAITVRRNIFGGADLTCPDTNKYRCVISQPDLTKPIRIDIDTWNSRQNNTDGWNIEIVNDTDHNLHTLRYPASNITIADAEISPGGATTAKGARSALGGPANLDFGLSPRQEAGMLDQEIAITVATTTGNNARLNCHTTDDYRCTITQPDPTQPIRVHIIGVTWIDGSPVP